ncbi:hypothetical protein [Crenalkalicoccus roseus]|nr:hypothetical protein [Crenalkalicoccus roseus]
MGSACLADYKVEFRPLSVALWQGFAGGVGAVGARRWCRHHPPA